MEVNPVAHAVSTIFGTTAARFIENRRWRYRSQFLSKETRSQLLEMQIGHFSVEKNLVNPLDKLFFELRNDLHRDNT